MPLRAKVTSGPVPGGPGGWWGRRAACPVMPGLIAASAPNSSVRIRSAVMPRSARASRMSVMNSGGPQMYALASAGTPSAASFSLVSRPVVAL
jgi:hypothetical protein